MADGLDLGKQFKEFTQGVQKFSEGFIPGGIKGGVGRVQNLLATDPGALSLTRLRGQAVPTLSGLTNPASKFRLPFISQQAGEDIGFGLSGALSLTPFQARPTALGIPLDLGLVGPIDRKGAAIEQRTRPQTERQQTAERVGRAIYGTALTLPAFQGGLAAKAIGIGGKALKGSILSTGLLFGKELIGGPLGELTRQIKANENIDAMEVLSKSKLPSATAIKDSIIRGVEYSWGLTFTDMALDAIIAPTTAAITRHSGLKLPDMTQSGVFAAFDKAKAAQLLAAHGGTVSKAALAKYYTLGGLHVMSRALLEAPGEDIMFTAQDILAGKDKRPYLEAVIANFPREVQANLVWGGFQIASGAPVRADKTIMESVFQTMKNVGKQFVDVGKAPEPAIAPVPVRTSEAGFLNLDKFIPAKVKSMAEKLRIKGDLAGKPQPEYKSFPGSNKQIMASSGTQDPVLRASESVRSEVAIGLDGHRITRSASIPEELVDAINNLDVSQAKSPTEAGEMIKEVVKRYPFPDSDSLENSLSFVDSKAKQKQMVFDFRQKKSAVTPQQRIERLKELAGDPTLPDDQKIELQHEIHLLNDKLDATLKTANVKAEDAIPRRGEAELFARAGGLFGSQAGFIRLGAPVSLKATPGKLSKANMLVGSQQADGRVTPVEVKPNLFAFNPKSKTFFVGHTEGENFGIKLPFDNIEHQKAVAGVEGTLTGKTDADSMLRLSASNKFKNMVRGRVTEDGEVEFYFDPIKALKMTQGKRVESVRNAAQRSIKEGLSPDTPAKDVSDNVKGETLGELAGAGVTNEFESVAAAKFGTDENIGALNHGVASGGYITTRGDFVLGDHIDIAQQTLRDLGKPQAKGAGASLQNIYDYMSGSDNVRIESSGSEIGIEILGVPTKEQFDAIRSQVNSDINLITTEYSTKSGGLIKLEAYTTYDEFRSAATKQFRQAGFAALPGKPNLIKKEVALIRELIRKAAIEPHRNDDPVEATKASAAFTQSAKRKAQKLGLDIEKDFEPVRIDEKGTVHGGDFTGKVEDITAAAQSVKTSQQVTKTVKEGPPTVKVKPKAKAAKAEVKTPRVRAKKTRAQQADPRHKYQFNINKDKNALSDKGQEQIDTAIKVINTDPNYTQARDGKNRVDGKTDGTITHQEILEDAQTSIGLKSVMTREQIKAQAAAALSARQMMVAGANGLTKQSFDEFVENTAKVAVAYREAGVILNSAKILAEGLPMEDYVKEKIIKDLLKMGVKLDDIKEAGKNVDFENPAEVTKFYREFIEPGIGEIVDEMRYYNLLSSPQTHIVNGFSNMLQATVLAPGVKLYSGGIDAIAAKLKHRDRLHYISEVPAYYKGLFNAIPEAAHLGKLALQGKLFVDRPDVRRIRTNIENFSQPLTLLGKSTAESPIRQALSAPFRALGKAGRPFINALEASDIFFRSLIKAGELEALSENAAKTGKQFSPEELEKLATDRAAYFIFRQPIDPSGVKTGQGRALRTIDKVTSGIYSLRNVRGVKWFIPFVQTPVNILKQGLEFSPLGFGTVDVAKQGGTFDQTEQLAKAFMGTTVFAMASYLAAMGATTFAPPRGKKERQIFYASGRKPYAIRIGDEWVSYSRLGPLAYPIAMASAFKYYYDEAPGKYTDGMLTKTGNSLLGIAGFFSDQSYMQGMGDMIDLVRGEPQAATKGIANLGRQLVPLTSLLSWTARLIDPVYRDPKGIQEDIQVGIPGFSTGIKPHLDPLGRPSERKQRFINAITPGQVSPVNPFFEEIWQQKVLSKQINNIKTKARNQEITEQDAEKALKRLLRDLDGSDKVDTDSLLNSIIRPVLADERPQGETITLIYNFNQQTGLFEDVYGNPGPDQPDPSVGGYAHDFILNPETGMYEDIHGNPAPLEIAIDAVNPEMNLEEVFKMGEELSNLPPEEKDKLHKLNLGGSASISKKIKVPKLNVPSFKIPTATKPATLKISQPTRTRVRQPERIRLAKPLQVQLPPKWQKANNLVRAR